MLKKYYRLIIIVFSFTLSGLLATLYSQNKFDAENFALGNATSSHFASVKGFPIHINKLNDTAVSQLKSGYVHSEKESVFLILGNSQTHSINQLQEGQNTYVLNLHEKDTSRYVICHSIQNASMQYFLLSLSYISDEFNVSKVLLPVFFDDYREDGIRPLFYESIVSEMYQVDTTLNPVVQTINREIEGFNQTEVVTTKKSSKSTQDITEHFLDSSLAANMKTWAARPNFRGQLFANLYHLRNSAFGINAQSVRQKIPARYQKNMDCYRAILELCRKKQIETLVYIPPIRNDVAIPYNVDDYNTFKDEIQSIADSTGNTRFVNLESLVPGEYWGMKASTSNSKELEYDFMHFQFKGHQLLDSALSKHLDFQQ
ncbi:MAG: hypothetical protein ACI9JN_002844 [Bacteroidia bacterium]|jgi:hypothetical protein